MRLVRHAHESGELVALRAGRQDDDALRRILVDLFGRDHSVLFRLEEPELLADIDVLLHGAAFDADFLAVFLGEFDDLHQALEKR